MFARKLFFLCLLTTLFVIPVVLIPNNATLNPAVNSKELASRVLVGLLGVTFLAALPAIRRRRLDLPQMAIILYLVVMALSWGFSGRLGALFFTSWHLWGFVALALALCQFIASSRQVMKILVVIVLGAAVVSGYGFSVYLGYDPLRVWYPFVYEEEARNYIHSFIGNPEYFGGYMASVGSVCFAMFLRPGTRRFLPRFLWLFAAFYHLFALLLSGTRGAMLGFLVAAGVILLSQLPLLTGAARRKLIIALGAMCVLGAAVFAVFSFPNRLNTRNLQLAKRFVDVMDLTTPAVRERIFFAGVTGRMIAETPLLGGGPGAFRVRFYPAVAALDNADSRAGVQAMIEDLQNRVAEHAHNDYLEIWSDTGTLGLAALLLILVTAAVRFHSLVPRIRTAPDSMKELSVLRTAVFAGALCIFFNALLSFPLHLPVRASLAWVLTGCFFALDARIRTELKGNRE